MLFQTKKNKKNNYFTQHKNLNINRVGTKNNLKLYKLSKFKKKINSKVLKIETQLLKPIKKNFNYTNKVI